MMGWGSPRLWLRSPPCAPLTSVVPACPAVHRAVQPWQEGMLGEMLPPHAGVRMSQHRAREMRTCRGIMPIHRPLTPRKSSTPWPYLPLPRPLAPAPPPPRLMGFLDMETSCICSLGCAWEPLNGNAAVPVGRSDGRHPRHPSYTLPAPMGDGAAPRSRAHCQTLACSCGLNVRLRTLTFTA